MQLRAHYKVMAGPVPQKNVFYKVHRSLIAQYNSQYCKNNRQPALSSEFLNNKEGNKSIQGYPYIGSTHPHHHIIPKGRVMAVYEQQNRNVNVF
jgi:hypothetical protein